VTTSSTRLRLRVSPGARHPGVVGRFGSAWRVRVAAPPERGKANDAVVRLLAGALSVAPGDVEVISGYAARDKIVIVAGLGPDETDRRLSEASLAGKDDE
jgi:uncharacterized protein